MTLLLTDQKCQEKKKSKYADYVTAPADAVYFLFDVETTGSKRNFDCIIALSFIAYDITGNLLDCFSQKINPGDVPINSKAFEIHGKYSICIMH